MAGLIHTEICRLRLTSLGFLRYDRYSGVSDVGLGHLFKELFRRPALDVHLRKILPYVSLQVAAAYEVHLTYGTFFVWTSIVSHDNLLDHGLDEPKVDGIQ
jgi:hypothetical protein